MFGPRELSIYGKTQRFSVINPPDRPVINTNFTLCLDPWFVSLRNNYAKPNTPLLKAKPHSYPEANLTRNPRNLKSGSNDYTTKQSQVTVHSPELVQDIFV